MNTESAALKSRLWVKAAATAALLTRPKTVMSLKLGALAVVLLCLALYILNTWSQYHALLLIGRDGRLSNWLLHQSVVWNSPFNITTLNPFQGMGSMLLPVNAWWIPGSWPLLPSGSLKQTLSSEFAYACELFLATLILARSVRLDLISGIIAATACLLLLFPPFNFGFGLQGWIATAPIYGHTLALVALSYASIAALKVHRGQAAIARGLVLAALFLGIVFLLIAAAPFWNAGMLVGTGIGLACIGLSSSDLRTFLWRAGTGVALIAASLVSGLVRFLISAHDSSARFVDTVASNPIINWHVLSDLPPLSRVLNGFCASGIACAAPHIEISTYYIHLLVLIGAGLLVVFGVTRESRKLGAIVGLTWIGLYAYWYSLMIGLFAATSLSPVYTYLPLYPLLLVVAAGGFSALAHRIGALLPQRARWLTAVVHMAAIAAGIFWLAINPWLPPSSSANAQAKPADALLSVLQEKLSLAPNTPFKGSVATAYGVPGGSLRRHFRMEPGQAEPNGQYEKYLSFVEEKTGSTLSLLDLWERNIPSLEEYGQAITLALKSYQRAFLSNDFEAKDHLTSHFVLVRKLNVPILGSMGVRFVITDGTLASDVAHLRATLPLDESTDLNLYELSDPNIGDWSLTELRPATSVKKVIDALLADPDLVRRAAFVNEPFSVNLMPARESALHFVRGGVVYEGQSEGTSAVLLPLQFSRCLVPTATGSGKLISVQRANKLHTVIVFSGDIKVHLAWNFGLADARCRSLDVEDAAR